MAAGVLAAAGSSAWADEKDLTASAGPMAAASTYEPSSKSLVSSQLTGLLASGGDYMKMARSKAAIAANRRGMAGSTMALQAGEAAAMESAMPIATADAAAHLGAQRDNTAAQNTFATAANEFGRTAARDKFKGVLDAAASERTDLTNRYGIDIGAATSDKDRAGREVIAARSDGTARYDIDTGAATSDKDRAGREVIAARADGTDRFGITTLSGTADKDRDARVSTADKDRDASLAMNTADNAVKMYGIEVGRDIATMEDGTRLTIATMEDGTKMAIATMADGTERWSVATKDQTDRLAISTSSDTADKDRDARVSTADADRDANLKLAAADDLTRRYGIDAATATSILDDATRRYSIDSSTEQARAHDLVTMYQIDQNTANQIAHDATLRWQTQTGIAADVDAAKLQADADELKFQEHRNDTLRSNVQDIKNRAMNARNAFESDANMTPEAKRNAIANLILQANQDIRLMIDSSGFATSDAWPDAFLIEGEGPDAGPVSTPGAGPGGGLDPNVFNPDGTPRDRW